jgi:hypothetical protein
VNRSRQKFVARNFSVRDARAARRIIFQPSIDHALSKSLVQELGLVSAANAPWGGGASGK